MSEAEFSLYARPSFLEGVARLVDWAGTLNKYNTSASSTEADYRALLSDWGVTGQDLTDAIEQFKKQYPQGRE